MSIGRGWLAFPRATVLALLLAALLGTPTLFTGQFADDYLHTAAIEGRLPMGGPLDLYRFADGDAERTRALTRQGPYPWWTLPELKLAFWRPLSSALAVVEHHVLGDRLVARHLHSVVWHLGLVGLMAALMRRLLPGAVGVIALLLFAVDEAHFLPVAWLANRNALVAAVPAFLALWLHLRWREDGRRWALPASLLAWSAGLMGGETAVGMIAYGVAYEVFAAPGSWQRRVAALLPLALLFAGYAVIYRHLGYGAWGSGTYLDPAAQTGSYLRALGPRLLALSGGALLNVPGELATSTPVARWISLVAGAFSVAVFAELVRRLWPALSREEQRHTRWLGAGAALSLLPVASTFPSNRLLLVPGLGASVLIAIVIVHGWRRLGPAPGRGGSRGGAVALAVLHLVLPVPAWALLTWGGLAVVRHGETVAREAELDPLRIASQRVAVLVVPDPLIGLYVGLIRKMSGLPAPAAWWSLTLAPHDHRLVRTGPASLELEVMEGRFLRSLFEQLFRSMDHPMRTGDKVELDGVTVRIVDADALGPRRIAYAFDRALEDPSLVFLVWRDGKLRRYLPPPVGGESVFRFAASLDLLR